MDISKKTIVLVKGAGLLLIPAVIAFLSYQIGWHNGALESAAETSHQQTMLINAAKAKIKSANDLYILGLIVKNMERSRDSLAEKYNFTE